jgi:phosphatidylinositol phospholipase C delta
MDGLASAVSKLKPFSHAKPKDDDDKGEATDHPLAGGGHAGRHKDHTHQLRVSNALRSYLVKQKILSNRDAGVDDPDNLSEPLRRILHSPHAIVPPELTDRSFPLQDYFISSSHNTYLLAHQLYGNSSAEAYEEHLKAGARCVEIDAWDGDDKDEPRVTHGWTLTANVPFRTVCETIRDVVDYEQAQATDQQGYRAAPILISLENHCGPQGQQAMVDIMKKVFGGRLLSKAVREKAHQEQAGISDDPVTLAELGSKIALIVEYHFPGEAVNSDDSDSDSEDEMEREERRRYKKEREEAAPSAVIIPSLSELGVYAQSVKPPNNAWFEKGILEGSPHHPLINVSETGLAAHLPVHAQLIAQHNSNHLMRVYPKGTRISSGNLNPVPFWDIGAQICALNWQTFGASMQLNEALFTGTDGYVLKPTYLRQRATTLARTTRRKRLRLHVAGATDIPVPADRPQDGSDIKPYLTCALVDPSHIVLEGDPPKKKTAPYRQHHLTGAFHHGPNPLTTDPVWDDVLEWEYQDDEMVFLRMLIKSDDAFAANPKFAVAAVRLLYVVKDEWVFVRMLSLKGQATKCSLLVKFEIRDA